MSAQAATATMKKTAMLAAVGVDAAQLDLFKSSLQKLGIQVQPTAYDPKHPPKGADVSAFVVRLGVGAEEVLTTIRSVQEHRDTVIYAVGSEADVMGLAQFEISVLLPDLSPPAVNDAVQSTYQLLLHQIRKYARIPIVIPVQMGVGDSSLMGISRNISAGGMSVSFLPNSSGTPATAASMALLQPDTVLQTSFNLPHSSRFHMSSVLVRKSDKMASFQFLGSPDQEALKGWIERYLQK
jgi:hypothetical protein